MDPEPNVKYVSLLVEGMSQQTVVGDQIINHPNQQYVPFAAEDIFIRDSLRIREIRLPADAVIS